MIGAVTVGLVATGVVRSRGGIPAWLIGGLAGGLLVAPAPTVAAAFLAWATVRFGRAAAVARAARGEAEASIEVAELLALGLAGGLSVAAAHRVALAHAPAEIVPALADLVGAMGSLGVALALAADEGPLAAGSLVLLGATTSGAPALPALEAHIRQEHHRRHTVAVEAARRLPIRLLLPLTLLVLPGFVLITVGPAVIDSLARLGP